MAGWNRARDDLDNEKAAEKAAKERASRLASQAAQAIFDSLDKPVQQFVKTLHDHNQWPKTETQKRILKEARGFFRTKQETQIVKVVTEQYSLSL